MIMTDPADQIRAKGAKRVTLAEARLKITHAPEGTVIYLSKGLQALLTRSDSEFVADIEKDVSVFEAFV